jgi:hypothetical protein
MYSMYFLNQIKKCIFTSKLHRYSAVHKTSKTKNVLKIFNFFVYSVQGTQCRDRRKFLADREYSSTVKNRRK